MTRSLRPAGGSPAPALPPPQHGWLVARLLARQIELQAAIQAERARPVPDQALIRRMERETQLGRDRIAAIERNDLPPWACAPAGGAA
jgi:hypothetical protein